MKLDKKRGILTFNTQELDPATLKICRTWVNDTLLRFKMVESAPTKAQTARNKQMNHGLKLAVYLLDALEKNSTKNLDLQCMVIKEE